MGCCCSKDAEEKTEEIKLGKDIKPEILPHSNTPTIIIHEPTPAVARKIVDETKITTGIVNQNFEPDVKPVSSEKQNVEESEKLDSKKDQTPPKAEEIIDLSAQKLEDVLFTVETDGPTSKESDSESISSPPSKIIVSAIVESSESLNAEREDDFDASDLVNNDGLLGNPNNNQGERKVSTVSEWNWPSYLKEGEKENYLNAATKTLAGVTLSGSSRKISRMPPPPKDSPLATQVTPKFTLYTHEGK